MYVGKNKGRLYNKLKYIESLSKDYFPEIIFKEKKEVLQIYSKNSFMNNAINKKTSLESQLIKLKEMPVNKKSIEKINELNAIINVSKFALKDLNVRKMFFEGIIIGEILGASIDYLIGNDALWDGSLIGGASLGILLNSLGFLLKPKKSDFKRYETQVRYIDSKIKEIYRDN